MYQALPTNNVSALSLTPPSSTSPPPRRRSRLSADSCFGRTLILLLTTSILLFVATVYQVHKQLHRDATLARQWEARSSSDWQQLAARREGHQPLFVPSPFNHSLSRTNPLLLRITPSSAAAQRIADTAEDAAYYSDHTLLPVSAIEQQAAAVLLRLASQLIPDPPTSLNLSAIAAHLSHYTLLWDFGGVGCSGFAIEASNLLYGLSLFLPTSSLFVIRSSHTCPGLPPYIHSLLAELSNKPPPPLLDILISHKPPPQYPLFPYRSYNRFIRDRPAYVIGRSMTEVHRVPREWGDRVNERVDECWLTSGRQVPPFLLGGTEATRLWVVGEPLDVRMWDVEERRQRLQKRNGSFVQAGEEGSGLTIKGRRGFNFLSVFSQLAYSHYLHDLASRSPLSVFC